jgi:hypothetical protein
MPPTVQVGTILMKDWPLMTQLLGIESENFSGNWNLVSQLDAPALDSKLHASGWNYFFMAAEVKVMFLGNLGAKRIGNALKRILAKVKGHHFNGLEVTDIVAKHFLGVPYAVVSAHCRHIQQSCYLDSTDARRVLQVDRDVIQ